jgi:ATP-dependent RNA helicase RhlE
MTTSPKQTQGAAFASLNLIPELLEALIKEDYHFATPIQSQAIPYILEKRDLLGCAQTGTGKTAAFALPILQNLSAQKPARTGALRALVLTPTRELAAQIAESFDRYGDKLGHRAIVIFGGVGQGPQVSALKRNPEILIATPGRLLDLIEQGFVNLKELEIFVLDEADRMLDMGFIHDVRRVLKFIPPKRQSLFFSATMPPDIQRLAQDILSNPVKVEVTPVATTAEKIKQSIFFVEKEYKRGLLEHLLRDESITRALVFTRTKHGANKVAEFLNKIGVKAEAIHGNKSQNNRVRALENFKKGQIRILVATDIAARGIDIDQVSHVINFELPNIPESYVHRIGRTARAGAEGISFSFCDQEERAFLRDIERTIRMNIDVVEDHPFAGKPSTRSPEESSSARRQHQPRRGGQGSRGRSGGGRSKPSSPASASSSFTSRRSHPRREPHASASGSRGPRRPSGASGGGRSSRPQPSSKAPASTASTSKVPWWKRLTGLE